MEKHERCCPEECILCRKNFQWEEVIDIKAPEFIGFCLPCLEKWEDKKKYDPFHSWIVHTFTGPEKFVFGSGPENG